MKKNMIDIENYKTLFSADGIYKFKDYPEYLAVVKDKKWGIINNLGEVIIPIHYDTVGIATSYDSNNIKIKIEYDSDNNYLRIPTGLCYIDKNNSIVLHGTNIDIE